MLLPAATKLGQGNIFTGVCLSTEGGGVSASVHAGIYPPDQTPPHPEQAPSPPDQTPPKQTPPDQTPPGSRHPPDQTPPGADTPPDQTPRSRHPPREETPPTRSRLQHTVNEQPVRILLECILVLQIQVIQCKRRVFALNEM